METEAWTEQAGEADEDKIDKDEMHSGEEEKAIASTSKVDTESPASVGTEAGEASGICADAEKKQSDEL